MCAETLVKASRLGMCTLLKVVIGEGTALRRNTAKLEVWDTLSNVSDSIIHTKQPKQASFGRIVSVYIIGLKFKLMVQRIKV